jgi:hypothetical protein
MYLKKLAEQVIRRYNAGDPSRDNTLEKREVYLHLIQAINKRLKVEQFNVNMPMGEMVPPHASIATYALPISATGFEDTGFTRSNIGAPLTDQYYQAANGQYWINDDGDYWVASPASATLTITNVSTAVWTIAITGFTEVNGITFQDIADFFTNNSTNLNADATTGYFELQGISGSSVYRFATDGVTAASALVDGFQFTYDLTETVSTNEEVLSLVQSSHNNILAGTDSITFVSVDLYELTTDTQSDLQATATLPAQPINLPRGMGVWRIYSEKNPSVSWIPIQSGSTFMLDGMIDDSIDLLNTYEYFDNKTIYFNSTVAQMPSDMKVQMIIVDPEQISETDLLPIPADMEEDVITDVLRVVGMNQQEDNLNDGNPNNR